MGIFDSKTLLARANVERLLNALNPPGLKINSPLVPFMAVRRPRLRQTRASWPLPFFSVSVPPSDGVIFIERQKIVRYKGK